MKATFNRLLYYLWREEVHHFDVYLNLEIFYYSQES